MLFQQGNALLSSCPLGREGRRKKDLFPRPLPTRTQESRGMKLLGLLSLLVLTNVGVFPWALEAGGQWAFVSMDYLNEWLGALAARQGADYVPLRTAWGLELRLQPWPLLGFGVVGLSAQGGILGRQKQTLSVSFLGVTGNFELEFGLLGFRGRGEVGTGGIWAWADGLVEGSGLGWNASVRLVGMVFRLWTLEVWFGVGYRWARVPVLRTPRGELRPRDGAALDFSGPFGGLRLSWTG